MKRIYKALIGALISIILLYLLFKDIPLVSISELNERLSVWIIILSFLIYGFMNILRAIRIKRVFPNILFKKITGIVFIHNMINNILPFRIGELSYVYMIRKEQNSKDAISSLLILRFLDLVAVFGIFGVSLIFVSVNAEMIYTFIALAAVILMGILGLLIVKRIKRFQKILEVLKDYDKLKVSKLFFDSVLIWVFSFLFYYILTQALGIHLSFFEVSIASILIILSGILPISGLAGFGTTELGWAIGLVLFDISQELAISSGLIIHIYRIIFFVILGGIGFLLYDIRKKNGQKKKR